MTPKSEHWRAVAIAAGRSRVFVSIEFLSVRCKTWK
jgi:hypothetical protein